MREASLSTNPKLGPLLRAFGELVRLREKQSFIKYTGRNCFLTMCEMQSRSRQYFQVSGSSELSRVIVRFKLFWLPDPHNLCTPCWAEALIGWWCWTCWLKPLKNLQRRDRQCLLPGVWCLLGGFSSPPLTPLHPGRTLRDWQNNHNLLENCDRHYDNNYNFLGPFKQTKWSI